MIVVLDLAAQYVVFSVGVALLSLWVHWSLGRFAIVLAAALALQTGYIAMLAPMVRARVRPLVRWIGGDRGRDSAEAAWAAAAALPHAFFQSRLNTALRIVGNLLWAGLATAVLGLPGYAFPVLAALAMVTQLYAIAQLFFMMEIGMHPLLFEIAEGLTDVPIDDRVRVPLRRRLVATVPAIAIITAVAVAGLSANSRLHIGDLGTVVLVALAVTATVSLGLTVMLTGSVVIPINTLREATARVARGDLSVRVPVVTSDETGELTRSFNKMVEGLQERERLHHAFGTFVDPQLAERVLRDGTDLAGDEVDLSILFLDVRGFTGFAERASARNVVARLNDLYEQVVPVVLRHGGHANKFIGDGLLAIFGAPERHPDHADRAVAAALEMAALVRERYRGELRIGIGVNSGRAVVGTVGGGGRLDFTVIGDTVNTAARVESATRTTDDDVLITGATRARLSAATGLWNPRPSLPLKGKVDAVELFAPEPATAERHLRLTRGESGRMPSRHGERDR
jgi:class 3 adenylate cyclase